MNRLFFFSLVTTLTLCACNLSVAGNYEDGLNALKSRDFSYARTFFYVAIQDLDIPLMHELVSLFLWDTRIPHRVFSRKMRELYKIASESGDSLAQYNLGVIYRKGLGGSRDYKEAQKYFTLSANQFNPWGQLGLGYMHLVGEIGVPLPCGVSINYAEAQRLFTLAANQGLKRAQDYLEYMEEYALTVNPIIPIGIHEGDECSVCLDTFVLGHERIRTLHCGPHFFHSKCLTGQTRCPLCRTPIDRT